jgi:hypothetical protein
MLVQREIQASKNGLFYSVSKDISRLTRKFSVSEMAYSFIFSNATSAILDSLKIELKSAMDSVYKKSFLHTI